MKNSGNLKLNRVVTIVILFLVGSSLALLSVSKTSSKYVIERVSNQVLTAKDFHFSSNYLVEKSKKQSYTIYDYQSGINLVLYNYELDNILLSTKDDISYTLDYTYYDKDDKIIQSVGPIKEMIKSADQQNNINIPYLEHAVRATVKAESVAPFRKSLYAEFFFKDADSSSFYRIVDRGAYVDLIIMAGKDMDMVTISWNPSFGIDCTNPLALQYVNAIGNDTSLTLDSLKANHSYTLSFFKNDSNAGYSTEDIKVEDGATIQIGF